MNKLVFLFLIIVLLSLNLFAQSPSFTGSWVLDKGKSKLTEQQTASIESQILTALQTDKDIKVTVKTELKEKGGPAVDLGGSANTFTFDGKESVVNQNTQIGQMQIKLKGEIKDSQLKLQISRTFNTQMGKVTTITKEVWTLSENRTTLTIKRESETPRGTISSELVYKKTL